MEDAIIDIFTASRNNYGTRKIKVELRKQTLVASRRKIGQITKSDSNKSAVKNELNRELHQEEAYAVVVSDLTYVRVDGERHYVCLCVDLFT
ncbi:hypothetical protein GON22_23385 [Paenibacillus sp. MMS18-CY102]|nr:hypothetical protein [Paenibacillus sp. MMS18-CY102]